MGDVLIFGFFSSVFRFCLFFFAFLFSANPCNLCDPWTRLFVLWFCFFLLRSLPWTMIARITGRLEELTPTSATVDVGGGLWYEVLVPACDSGRLAQKLGQEITLHTLHFIEGDASFGSQTPRLVGFLSTTDRQFFRTFTTVKGIGIRTALKALERPVGEIAAAIQGKDARFLATLPKIGKRTAEQIIAELHGKVEEYVGPAAAAAAEAAGLSEPAAEAVSVLVQLGERRPDALALVERVVAVDPEAKTPEEIIRLVYRLKAGAK